MLPWIGAFALSGTTMFASWSMYGMLRKPHSLQLHCSAKGCDIGPLYRKASPFEPLLQKIDHTFYDRNHFTIQGISPELVKGIYLK